MGRVVLGCLILSATVLLGGISAAKAQVPASAVVTNVVDGDTLDARLADGQEVSVRLIGIDTPEVGECGTDQATDYMERLALGRNVRLVGDPTQDAVDRYGRSLFYIDRDDGLDVGREMVSAGWADVYVYDQPFERLDLYRGLASDAEGFERGVWADCDGQFHRSRADERRAESEARERSAISFMRRYYRRLSIVSSRRRGQCLRPGSGSSSASFRSGRLGFGALLGR